MEIITSLDAELKNKYPATVIALGTFDGLHLGHTDVINTAKDYAERSGLKLAVFTFSNHPLALIRPDLVPVRIISAEEKIKLLESFGVDYLINIPFTEDFAALSPDEFLDRLACFNYRCLVVGENFTYGFLGSGKTETLERSGRKNGFDVIVRPLVKMNGNVVSSTGIRNLIQAGHIEYANRMLGRAYSITGKIVHGEQRGRKLGFPTANIELLHGEMAVPAPGVYAVTASIEGSIYEGMGNIGNNPTFNDVEHARLEVNLFNCSGDLYGKTMSVQFHKYIRAEKKFSGVEELCRQIEEDKKAIKTYFLNKKQLPDT
ncbi:bifunctional riboflavin kinase/FAD synthetase [Phascolarctobacterium faecium]|nr:bifunctional riboflavin kinase/FAD synthetase [Phascolarctobacterium faecium]MDM8108842.1 bifunctional riboflavin kinase/FAD synthetase [Phascolarctobacterium faecium]